MNLALNGIVDTTYYFRPKINSKRRDKNLSIQQNSDLFFCCSLYLVQWYYVEIILKVYFFVSVFFVAKENCLFFRTRENSGRQNEKRRMKSRCDFFSVVTINLISFCPFSLSFYQRNIHNFLSLSVCLAGLSGFRHKTQSHWLLSFCNFSSTFSVYSSVFSFPLRKIVWFSLFVSWFLFSLPFGDFCSSSLRYDLSRFALWISNDQLPSHEPHKCQVISLSLVENRWSWARTKWTAKKNAMLWFPYECENGTNNNGKNDGDGDDHSRKTVE